MKNVKRIVSALLAVIMALSVFTVVGFAAENEQAKEELTEEVVSMLEGSLDEALNGETPKAETKKEAPYGGKYKVYTALGDSASSGYGRPEYEEYGSLVLYGKRIPGSYVDLLGTDLGAETVYPYGVSGIRTTELRYLLDDNFHGDYILDNTMKTLSNDMITREHLLKLREPYRNAVRTADLITLDIGFDDIWVPTIACIYDIAEDGRYDGDDAEKTVAEKIAEYGTARVVIDNVVSYLRAWFKHPVKWAYYWDAWAMAVTKWLMDFTINYNSIVDRIFEMNPDVTVIAVGCYNPCNEWSIVPGDASIEHFIQMYYDLVNAEKTAPESKYKNYHYVSTRNVEIMSPKTTVPLYENLTLDESGFNPHPTADGHKDIEQRILKQLDKINK